MRSPPEFRLGSPAFLTNLGRATLTQTTLYAIAVHVSICCNLSTWAIGEIDKRRRAFLWAGIDSVADGKCRVAWAGWGCRT
jgi:hypothetical protein